MYVCKCTCVHIDTCYKYAMDSTIYLVHLCTRGPFHINHLFPQKPLSASAEKVSRLSSSSDRNERRKKCLDLLEQAMTEPRAKPAIQLYNKGYNQLRSLWFI